MPASEHPPHFSVPIGAHFYSLSLVEPGDREYPPKTEAKKFMSSHFRIISDRPIFVL